jgi:hypothetical protein
MNLYNLGICFQNTEDKSMGRYPQSLDFVVNLDGIYFVGISAKPWGVALTFGGGSVGAIELAGANKMRPEDIFSVFCRCERKRNYVVNRDIVTRFRFYADIFLTDPQSEDMSKV